MEKSLYDTLLEKKKSGIKLTKKNLDYETLYTLAIKENKIDGMIAELFDITKEQVRYLRKKHNLSNKYLKRMVDFPEPFLQKYPEAKDTYYEDLKKFAAGKENWNPQNYENYVKEKLEKEGLFQQDLGLRYTSIEPTSTKNSKTSSNTGANRNQSEEFYSRMESGKIGEKLVYDSEVKKLKEYGFNDLKVEWVAKTTKEEITKDGTGYDIISYNEKKEKIFIEVKCSLTNAKGFHLSKKELQFVCGELEELNSKLCYIYFVYNVNKEHTKADCFILDKEKILQYEIEPTQYYVRF